MFQNIADLKDPNDNQGRSYREVNNATKHSFNIGDLVELETGERLFICKLTRDCDGTPLYNLGINGIDATINGYSEDCLKLFLFK